MEKVDKKLIPKLYTCHKSRNDKITIEGLGRILLTGKINSKRITQRRRYRASKK
jgi:hypothetical protein